MTRSCAIKSCKNHSTRVKKKDGVTYHKLSQAHCRLMYRTTILPIDAIVAVSLMDLAMQDCTLSDTVDALHSTFQKYPDYEYLCTAKQLLHKLSLDEIWKQELLYYGKLMHIDHKTLDNEIENRSTHYFANFDDVSDDSIPLPASLITSSYFNIKKVEDKSEVTDDGKENRKDIVVDKVNEKLAENLKKHATLNKEEKKPVLQNKIPAKRKRKEVTVDTSKICKKTKRTNKRSPKNDRDGISDSEEENDPTKLLNAVPSVNDFFAELDIDLRFDNIQDITNCSEIVVNRHSTQKNSYTNKNVDKSETKNEIMVNIHDNSDIGIADNSNTDKSENGNEIIVKNHEDLHKNTSLEDHNTSTSSTRDKLKRYQYAGKHDLSKYEFDIEKSTKRVSETAVPTVRHQNCTVVHLQNAKEDSKSSHTNTSKRSIPSSQLSIFDSSDCDIDFDI